MFGEEKIRNNHPRLSKASAMFPHREKCRNNVIIIFYHPSKKKKKRNREEMKEKIIGLRRKWRK